MVDGVRYIATFPAILNQIPIPFWSSNRGTNILDSGAPWYDTHKTKDGKYMAVYCPALRPNIWPLRGPLEPHFYAAFLKGLELDQNNIPDRTDQSQWNELRRIFTEKFGEKTQKEWTEVFDGTDACVTPVIPLSNKDNRPLAGFSESPGLDIPTLKPGVLEAGTGGSEVLKEWLGWTKRDFMVDSKGTIRVKSKANL
jgi:alpha-methylacyl-CoA racemase